MIGGNKYSILFYSILFYPISSVTTYGEKYGGSWRKRAAVWKIPAQGEAGQASQFYA
jgi:hypothetical protein